MRKTGSGLMKGEEKPEQAITLTTQGLQETLNCGRQAAVEIGEAAEAKVKVGRRVLWNVSKIQSYLDMICE